MALRAFLRHIEAIGEARATDIHSLQCRVLSYVPEAHHRALAFRLTGEARQDGRIPLRFKLDHQGAGDAKNKNAKNGDNEVLGPFGMNIDALFLPHEISAPAARAHGAAAAAPAAKAEAKKRPDDGADSDADAGAADAEESEEMASIPAGHRLGVVGFEHARTDRAYCFHCKARIAAGEAKMFWRTNRGKVEKSVHSGCLRHLASDASVAACRESYKFIINLINEGTVSPQDRRFLGDALAAVERRLGSLGHGGAGSSTD